MIPAVVIALGGVLATFGLVALVGAGLVIRRARRYHGWACECLRGARREREEGIAAHEAAKVMHANCRQPQIIALQIPKHTMPQFVGPRGVG